MFGSMTITAAALISPYRGPASVLSPAMTTGKVLASTPLKISANRNSFQEARNPKIAATTSPGAAMGMTTRTRTPSGEQPSISAASSTSSGTSTKNPTRSQMEKGSANET